MRHLYSAFICNTVHPKHFTTSGNQVQHTQSQVYTKGFRNI